MGFEPMMSTKNGATTLETPFTIYEHLMLSPDGFVQLC